MKYTNPYHKGDKFNHPHHGLVTVETPSMTVGGNWSAYAKTKAGRIIYFLIKDVEPVMRLKGDYAGQCNRTACKLGLPARFFNHSTLKYYCIDCARKINEHNGGKLCTEVKDGQA